MTDEEIKDSAIRAGFLSSSDEWWRQIIPRFRAMLEAERRKREALEIATRRWVKAADDWLATGIPATPKESESIYSQAKEALKNAGLPNVKVRASDGSLIAGRRPT